MPNVLASFEVSKVNEGTVTRGAIRAVGIGDTFPAPSPYGEADALVCQ
jgi:hypothetical protein